jgi:hypothetical protein
LTKAAKSPNGHTYVTLATPSDAWTKELIITTNNVYGYSLPCGDMYGSSMSGLNSHMKKNTVDLGIGSGPLSIQGPML